MPPRRSELNVRSAATSWVLAIFTICQTGCLVFHRRSDMDVIRAPVFQDGTTPGQTSASMARSDKAYRKGMKLYSAGKFPEATAALQRSVELDPANGRAHNNLGLLYFDQHQLAVAASHFDAATEFLPGDPTPINNLGMTLEAGGRTGEAIELYRRASEINPSNPLYLGNLVKAKLRTGEQDELLVSQMQTLLMIENRPKWIDWVRDQLNLDLNPALDRGSAELSLTGGETESNVDNPPFKPQQRPEALDDAGVSLEPPSQTLPPPMVIEDPIELPDSVLQGEVQWHENPPVFQAFPEAIPTPNPSR